MDKATIVMTEIVNGVDQICLCFLLALKFCFGKFLQTSWPPGIASFAHSLTHSLTH